MATERRMYRIANMVREQVSKQLLLAKDPRLSLVTITAVVINSDLGLAKVYWTVNEQDRIPEVEKAFISATSLFRKAIAKNSNIRFTPKLKFFYDNTSDTFDEVQKLINKINVSEY